MAFSIRSTNERLPVLVFGDFKVNNIRQWMRDNPEYDNVKGYPIEDVVSGFGSDLVDLFGKMGNIDIDFPSNAPNIFVNAGMSHDESTGEINNIGFAVQQRGEPYDGVGFAWSRGSIEAAYLMSTTSSLKENTEIMMIVKQRRKDGKIYWLIVAKGAISSPV